MDVLESCPNQHGPYFDKKAGMQFHDLLTFLREASIHNPSTGKVAGKKILEETVDAKGVYTKHGRKPPKLKPSSMKDPLFDEACDDTVYYMDTKEYTKYGRARFSGGMKRRKGIKGS
ncbi:hypothetical protein Tco_1071663 [Tanacetum coccineum]